MDVVLYKGFEIKASPHQLADSGAWSLNIYIANHAPGVTRERGFSTSDTFASREEAVRHCLDFGRQIIDGEVVGCTVADL